MDLDDLLDAPGDRIPLLTLGEAHDVLHLLRPLVDGAGVEAVVADELIVRLAQRVPAPPA
ncbi:hypothetical protein HW130_19785 [Streptomyces sp. PKU-EA00015]|uniref:hypothetical protein n=1 Tax=Streptomyces sp. PKU-EA00015 TaxID=2748326 RepID=UPI00159FB64D|nr:hypothetical protein [Streptomyces sp. PKU-EA00015]NWF28480.1 hypothetical protein [Streptomyces sp. PKU-EA00015]